MSSRQPNGELKLAAETVEWWFPEELPSEGERMEEESRAFFGEGW